MTLGNNLAYARKKSGFSQEEVAAKLSLSRQTISKWELDETIPDIYQAKQLSILYHVTLEELLDQSMVIHEIQRNIQQIDASTAETIDWSQVWAKQYPILASYQQEVDIPFYTNKLQALLQQLKNDYHYENLDAFLVLKDILGSMWRE